MSQSPTPTTNPSATSTLAGRASDTRASQAAGREYSGGYDDQSPAELQREIRQTRSRFDDHLDQLAQHLHPKALVQDVGEALRGGGSAFGKGLVRNVKRYPLPSAMIGAGIAWLLVSQNEDEQDQTPPRSMRGRRGRASSDIYGYRDDEARDLYAGSEFEDELQLSGDELAMLGTVYPEYGSYHELESESSRYGDDDNSESAMSYRQRLEAARIKARDAANRAAELAKDQGSSVMDVVKKAANRVTDLATATGRHARRATRATVQGFESGRHATGHGLHSAAQMSSNALHSVTSAGSQAVHGIGSTSRHLASSLATGYEEAKHTMQKSAMRAPLTAGVACLAAGLVAGLLIPATRREDEAFGSAANDLKGRATETAADAARRARQAAQATAIAALDAAREEGLTPSALKEQASHLAATTRDSLADTVKTNAQDEGLTPSNLKEKIAHVVQHTADTAKQEFTQQAKASDANKAAERATS